LIGGDKLDCDSASGGENTGLMSGSIGRFDASDKTKKQMTKHSGTQRYPL
jgi:hypothetical protein